MILSKTNTKLLLIVLISLFLILEISSSRFYSSILASANTPKDKTIAASNIPKCTDHNPNLWHPPVKKDSSGKIICVYAHEHGDPVPDWVTKAGYKVGFEGSSGFPANTSDKENTLKHPGMKGFEADIKNVKVYLRIHLASNPLDRTARFHSYEMFIKDEKGEVSHFQGWLDSGDPLKDRLSYQDSTSENKGKDPGTRPIVWAATRQACEIDEKWCSELWSLKGSAWQPSIIWGIYDSTTYYQPGETPDPDISKWKLTGALGGERSLSISILRNPDSLLKNGITKIPEGIVWASQFGEIVKSPNDEICKGSTLKYGISYRNICLKNYVSKYLPEISGVKKTSQKHFDVTGVQVPN